MTFPVTPFRFSDRPGAGTGMIPGAGTLFEDQVKNDVGEIVIDVSVVAAVAKMVRRERFFPHG